MVHYFENHKNTKKNANIDFEWIKNKSGLQKRIVCVLYMWRFFVRDMIQGAPKFVMIAFFALGTLLVVFSLWALYLTDIPQEQFLEDP